MIFGPAYAALYDELYRAKDYGQECDLIEAAFDRFGERPHSIVDVGCGTGRHLTALVQRGYRMAGVDLSEAMLDQARDAATTLPADQQPELMCGDARHFDFGRQFDAAIMMFAVIGYLTANGDVCEGLANIRRHVKPGGLFVCDFWYGPAVLATRPSDRVRVLEQGKQRSLRAVSTTLDSFRHTADVAIDLWTFEGDRVLDQAREKHQLRYFFPQEMALLLEESGFEPLTMAAFPSLDERPSEQSWNVLAVARAR